MRFRAILDHAEIMFPRNLAKPFHVNGMTEKMDGDDCACARSDQSFDQIEIQIPGVRFGIDWHRNEIVVIGGQCSRDVGGSANEDFLARRKIENCHRQMQRRGTITNCDPVFAAAIFGKGVLELRNRFTERT